jgi:hypothetical protein
MRSEAPASRCQRSTVRQSGGAASGRYLFLQDSPQLIPTLEQATSISGVDYPDKAIGLFIIIPPVRANCLLASDVPNVQAIAGAQREADQSRKWELSVQRQRAPEVLQAADLETERRADRVRWLPREFVDNRRFAGIIESPARRSDE